jgi:hypothetical protein
MAILNVEKKILKYPCYCCKKSIRGKTVAKKACKVCKKGYFIDEIYYHIVTDKKGKKYCFDADTIK